LGAVSPAVVVPSLLDLQEKGFGIDKGIPSFILASSSIDDIMAISFFGIFSSFAFSSVSSSNDSSSSSSSSGGGGDSFFSHSDLTTSILINVCFYLRNCLYIFFF